MENGWNQKRRYRQDIKKYLSELQHLVYQPVTEMDLLSLEETTAYRTVAIELEQMPIFSFTVDADMRRGENFSSYIHRLYLRNSEPMLLWTQFSNVCGAYVLKSIKEFNFSFEFAAVEGGVIVLLAKNKKDKLLLDFDTDEHSEGNLMTTEVRGKSWTTLSYK